MEKTFSIVEALQFGWGKTREHSGLLFKVILTLFALQVGQAVVGKILGNIPLMGVILSLALSVAVFIVGAGLTLIALKVAKGEPVTYADIVPPARVLWRYLLASLVAGLITMLGFVLLILPGIYLALRYAFVSFAALEGAGVGESLRRSAQATRGAKWHLLGLFIVAAILNLLGMLLLVVGLLVTIPITLIAYAHVYKKLQAAT